MVGINPSNIKYQKLTFGAYDTTTEMPLAAVPGEISNDPYTDRHGTTLKDPRGLLPSFAPEQKHLIPEYDHYVSPEIKAEKVAVKQHETLLSKLKPQSKNLVPEYDHYAGSNMQGESHPKRRSIIKPLLTLAVLVAGGVLAYKKRGAIANFFKKNVSNIAEESPRTGLKAEPNRISSDNFNTFYEDAYKKAYEDQNLNAIRLDNLQVIMSNHNHTIAQKRQHLENLYKLAEIYTHKDYQPRIILLMPESMKKQANTVATMFDKNRIDEVPDNLIEQIEGFKILNIKKGFSENHDMIVKSQVRHGVNADDAEDIFTKWGRNIRDFLKDSL
jgi:hypothetical protein